MVDMSILSAGATRSRFIALRATLAKSPFAGSAFAAEELTPHLIADQDYSSWTFCERDDKPPVFLTCSQDFRVLEDLVTTAFRMLGDLSYLFVGYWRRAKIQMPPALMDQRVLVLQGPDREVARLIQNGQSEILVIKDNFGVTGREIYDNSIRFELHATRHGHEDLERFLNASILRDCLRNHDWTWN